jgi:cardiolipin synthase
MSHRPVPGGFGRAADLDALRGQADRVFRRSAGAPLIAGNQVRVLRDAAENYPAWEEAISRATATVHIEMYIIHRDAVGRHFIQMLAERARAGVKVRVLYDWFGCGWNPVIGLFRPLVAAGGDVRVFNPPRLAAALAWTTRNHRKYICVDGRVTYIGGLCIGQMWAGRPERHQDPWRDTGVEISGPATAHGERGFAASWTFAGGHMDPVPEPDPAAAPFAASAGQVDLRLIYTEPFTAAMLRVDLLVTAMARRRLWIADAYFVGHGPYVQALQAAAREGVDVRLLLPQGSDVGWTVSVSRTLYRTLIESGVRIFEWNGSMMHAKTAVADSEWARVGSTNLNLNSWVGNWELDVAIENRDIAQQLEAHYEEDIANSTEIVATPTHLRREMPPGVSRRGRRRRIARRALRTATGVSHAVSAAVMGRRQLEAWESAPLLTLGLFLLATTVVGFWRPRILAVPLALAALWIGLSFVAQATGLAPRRRE